MVRVGRLTFLCLRMLHSARHDTSHMAAYRHACELSECRPAVVICQACQHAAVFAEHDCLGMLLTLADV